MQASLRKFLVALAATPCFALPSTSHAALDIGATAPTFSAPAALDGKPYTYSLPEQLAKGPVVLYFFPAAFTKGCSIEAHDFAQAIDQFAALHATVIGVSTDNMEVLSRFSSETCQGKFPVASDASKSISKSYDALMPTRPDHANRISYAIAPNGRIAAVYQSMDPDQHVAKMLAAVKEIESAAADK
jgi:peroxiredoxin